MEKCHIIDVTLVLEGRFTFIDKLPKGTLSLIFECEKCYRDVQGVEDGGRRSDRETRLV